MIELNRKNSKQHFDIGVICARFQTPILHEAHIALIEFVRKECHKVVIFLGVAPIKATYNNPLDFCARQRMLQDIYPDIDVYAIEDNPSDEEWSRILDSKVNQIKGLNNSVCLYGGRDGFLEHYLGNLTTAELESNSIISGTELRKLAGIDAVRDQNWRAGVTWATQHRFPTCYPCADVVVYDEEGEKILLSRKPNEYKYRTTAGGFVNPRETWEAAAKRELGEEVKGIEVSDWQYVGSYVIDDFRYQSEVDNITTSLYIAKYQFGTPKPNDDICECKWVNIHDVIRGDIWIHPNHKVLLNQAIEALKPICDLYLY